jgi:hypothetical protein
MEPPVGNGTSASLPPSCMKRMTRITSAGLPPDQSVDPLQESSPPVGSVLNFLRMPDQPLSSTSKSKKLASPASAPTQSPHPKLPQHALPQPHWSKPSYNSPPQNNGLSESSPHRMRAYPWPSTSGTALQLQSVMVPTPQAIAHLDSS